jgi:hypothetical protein
MLMVIFGAGASYDSCSSFPPWNFPRSEHLWHRPPLAKELFLPLAHFRGASEKYSRLQPLLPYLEAKVDIETILEEFRAESENDAERRSQLLAIQYYLRQMIASCQGEWRSLTRGVSNYKTLLDQVRGHSRVCFVTFNHDTLLENALEGIDVRLEAISDYTSHPKYSLIKPHGSIDWKLWIPKEENTSLIRFGDQPGEQDMIRAAPVVGERRIIEKEGRTPPSPPATGPWFFLPALAIPTVSKHTFVCPQAHVNALESLIPKVTKIAIIGWRAGEHHFLKKLKDGLTRPVPVIAACGGAKDSTETYERMEAAGIPADFRRDAAGAAEGFTEFVVNRRIEAFLSEPGN